MPALGERETMRDIGRRAGRKSDGGGNRAMGTFVAGADERVRIRREERGEQRVFLGGRGADVTEGRVVRPREVGGDGRGGRDGNGAPLRERELGGAELRERARETDGVAAALGGVTQRHVRSVGAHGIFEDEQRAAGGGRGERVAKGLTERDARLGAGALFLEREGEDDVVEGDRAGAREVREPELGGDAGFAIVDALGDELRGVFVGRMRRKRRGPQGGFARDGVDVRAQIKERTRGVDRGRHAGEVARDIDGADVTRKEPLHPRADLTHERCDGGGLGER